MNDPVHHRITTKFPRNRFPKFGEFLVLHRVAKGFREPQEPGVTSPVPNPHRQRGLAATTRTFVCFLKTFSASPRGFLTLTFIPPASGGEIWEVPGAHRRLLSSSFSQHHPPHSRSSAELRRSWTKKDRQQNSPGFAFQCKMRLGPAAVCSSSEIFIVLD